MHASWLNHLQVRHLPLQAYQILRLLLQLLGNSNGHSLALTAAAKAVLRTSPAAAACSRIWPSMMALPCCRHVLTAEAWCCVGAAANPASKVWRPSTHSSSPSSTNPSRRHSSRAAAACPLTMLTSSSMLAQLHPLCNFRPNAGETRVSSNCLVTCLSQCGLVLTQLLLLLLQLLL
jgi:hypothetical protein